MPVIQRSVAGLGSRFAAGDLQLADARNALYDCYLEGGTISYRLILGSAPSSRRVFRDAFGRPLDGLLYTSSRNGAPACVLFCENDQCVEPDYDRPVRNQLLSLNRIMHET